MQINKILKEACEEKTAEHQLSKERTDEMLGNIFDRLNQGDEIEL